MDSEGSFTSSVSVNSAMTIAILFSLKTMQSLQIGVATTFWSNSIVFNENIMAIVIAELTLMLDVNGP